jgi:hypothetical protein
MVRFGGQAVLEWLVRQGKAGGQGAAGYGNAGRGGLGWARRGPARFGEAWQGGQIKKVVGCSGPSRNKT